MEQRLGLTLQPDLHVLWERTWGLILLEDMFYGLWGLVIWSPDQALARHQRLAATWADDDRSLQAGDFLIGEFLDSIEHVVIRCDPQLADFGTIVIAQPIDSRHDWPAVAASLGGLIERFLDTNLQRFGEKYWQ